MLIVQISDLHVSTADAPVRPFVDTNTNLARAISYIEVGLDITSEAAPIINAEEPMFTLMHWNGDSCVSYLSGFDADVPRLDSAEEFGDWSRAVGYLRRDPPMPKQCGG